MKASEESSLSTEEKTNTEGYSSAPLVIGEEPWGW